MSGALWEFPGIPNFGASQHHLQRAEHGPQGCRSPELGGAASPFPRCPWEEDAVAAASCTGSWEIEHSPSGGLSLHYVSLLSLYCGCSRGHGVVEGRQGEGQQRQGGTRTPHAPIVMSGTSAALPHTWESSQGMPPPQLPPGMGLTCQPGNAGLVLPVVLGRWLPSQLLPLH